jgi:hypothetical protein
MIMVIAGKARESLQFSEEKDGWAVVRGYKLEPVAKLVFPIIVILSEAKNLAFSITYTLRCAQGDRKREFCNSF